MFSILIKDILGGGRGGTRSRSLSLSDDDVRHVVHLDQLQVLFSRKQQESMISDSDSLELKPAGGFGFYFEGQTDLLIGEMQQSHEGQRYRQVLGHGAGQAGGRQGGRRREGQQGAGHAG